MGGTVGIVFIVAGIGISFYLLSGLILLIIGAFVAFSSTSTVLDTDNKKIKLSNNFFGIIRVGKWTNITPIMKLGIKKVHKGYRFRSRSNRSLDMHNHDVRIVLFGFDGKQIMQVKKFKSLETAKTECRQLAHDLSLSLK